MTLRKFQPFLAAATVAFLAMPASAVSENSFFDGRWSVEIVPASGDCSTRTVALSVDEGQISYVGFGAKASGVIEPDGDLALTIAHRDKLVNASGSVENTTGAGNWASPDCEGTWTARRS